ncbi:SpoIIE family protein phosphatase [Angustibacter aerolatus]
MASEDEVLVPELGRRGSDRPQVPAAAASVSAGRPVARSATAEVLRTMAALAANLLDAPAAELSLLGDAEHVDVLAGVVPAGRSVPLEGSPCALVLEAAAPLVVTEAAGDTSLAVLEAVREGAAGPYLGVPLRDRGGELLGALCVHQPDPREWTPREVALLERVAAATAEQLRATGIVSGFERVPDARDPLLAQAVAAAGVGTFDWDLVTDELVWDGVLLDMFGVRPEAFGGTIDDFRRIVHPDDLPRVSVAIRTSIDTGSIYEAEFRVLRPDGGTRWVAARGRPLSGDGGAPVRLIGAVTDLTVLRDGEARVGHILDTMRVGFFHVDADWVFTYVNAEAERVLDRPREHLVGGALWERFPAAVGSDFEESYRRAVRENVTVTFDAYYPAPLDAWFEVRAVPEPDGLAAYFLDVTERREAHDAAERAAERASLLATVARELSDTLDATVALTKVAGLIVPQFADWAVLSILDDGPGHWRGRLRDVSSWHPDPAVHALLERYRQLRVPALTDASPVGEALRTGRPARAVRTSWAEPGQVLRAGEAHDLLVQLHASATLVLPLRGRGRVRGLMTLVNGDGRGPFDDEAVATLQEITTQVGLALDNARLHELQRGFAEELQRSLLAGLPEPDHLQIAARYVAATDGAQIGGDWYDAFLVRDGSTCLVIGDVTGHDREAAVAMAQIRNVLRGVAHAVVQPPAAMLSALDWALRDFDVEALGTAVLAKIEQTPGQQATSARTLRWSSAGHLPPLLVGADGRAELLQAGSDLLLGLDHTAPRRDHDTELPVGSTLLLYTDGLVERRGEDLDAGLERLRRFVGDAVGRGLSLEDVCDAVVDRLASDAEDDVALLAVRAHPEDRPRPAEAGPERLPSDSEPDPR